jgi:hypothetical protein
VTKAIASLTIPAGPGELSPEWLTAALRERGVLTRSRVVSFDQQSLGEGEGFVGTLSRLRIRYDVLEPAAPDTLIAKFPIGNRMNRRVGEMLGAYEREIRFYEELAPEIDLVTPRCFYSAFDPNPMEGREQEALDFLERFPPWLVRLALPLLLWFAGRSPRRYVLLLEDMSPRRFGDQVNGCDLARAEFVLRSLARFHASKWGDVGLVDRAWISRVDVLTRFGAEFFRRSRPLFKQNFGGRLPPRMLDIVDWLEGRVPALMRSLARCPSTLIHTDFRLDNLCFDDAGDMTVLDWQGPAFGPGEIDLAYFITGNVPQPIAIEHEARLCEAYHEELVANGVSGHSLEASRHAYDLAKLWVAMRMIPTDQMDFEEGRGRTLIDTWLDRLAALLPEDYEKLLD